VKTLPAILLIALGGFFAAACASMMREPTVDVSSNLNPLAPVHAVKTYRITCANELVQYWFLSNPGALVELATALEAQGYEEAVDPRTATYSIRVDLGFAPRAQLQMVENPDSVRYLNVAAMVGQGRYTQILTERHDSGGSLLVGPNGELIATGGWKKMEEDAKRTQEDTRDAGSHDSLILRAWDVTEPEREKRVFAWDITVRRRADHKMPSPEHVGILVRNAAQRVEDGFSAPVVAVADAAGAGKSPAGSTAR